MRPPRRQFLNYASWAAACAAIGPAALPLGAAGGDYKALLVLYLNGGNDGNNVLVPTDGAYSDYESSRGVLALPRSSLLSLPAPAAGHTFGLHPSLAPLMPLYYHTHVFLIQPSVKGWHANLLDHHPYKHVWLEK